MHSEIENPGALREVSKAPVRILTGLMSQFEANKSSSVRICFCTVIRESRFLDGRLTELCDCFICEGSEFQVRHAAIIVNNKYCRVALLECNKVALLVLRIAEELETVLDELFDRREGREPLGALFFF